MKCQNGLIVRAMQRLQIWIAIVRQRAASWISNTRNIHEISHVPECKQCAGRVCLNPSITTNCAMQSQCAYAILRLNLRRRKVASMDTLISNDALIYIFLGLIIFIGSTVQGVIGFGLGTISTPIMALLKPDLVPVVVLCLAFIIACSTLHRAWAETDWKMVLYSNLARLPGTFLAVWALAVLTTNSLQLFIGCAVIFTMILSSLGWTPKVNAPNTLIAGGLSGFLGTSTSIGGPPMALLMKTFNPAKARGTLAATFVFGSIVSMVTLAIGGQITTYQLKYAVIYLPLAILGLVAANYFNRFVDRRLLNRTVIIVSIGASLVLIIQSLLG